MTRDWIKFVIGWILLCSTVQGARAEIQLPDLLNHGAVLQRDEPIPVWGTAPANSLLDIRFAGEAWQVRVDEQGHWRTRLPPHKAGGPYTMEFSAAGFSRTLDDIWLGDVWLCSGQSNMEWVLRNSAGAATEIQAAPHHQIRHFKIPRSWAAAASDKLAGGDWQVATREQVGEFSGVGWYFATKVHQTTGIPIGLINATWGGSKIEAWMSPAALGKTPDATVQAVEQRVAAGEVRARSVKQSLQRWTGAVVPEVREAHADWSAADVDETDWLGVQVPGLWEEQQFAGVDGVIWYRRAFALNKSQAAAGITLGLGRIDDNDITWVNGRKIGATAAYDRVRTYEVPAEFLKEGTNQIAVRIEDTGGGGGIYSQTELVYWQTPDGRRTSLAGTWKIKADRVSVSVLDDIHQTDTALYNKMLHPLLGTPIKGALWYQGESNAGTAAQAENYRWQFPALIADWRDGWGKPEMPFYWVQLANFNSGRDTPEASPWAILRESQTAALALPNTGQAVTIDVGDPADIHPTDKKTVGERLARVALLQIYGQRKLAVRGPVYRSAKRSNKQLLVTFTTAGNLVTQDGGTLVKGFEIAAQDGRFKPVAGTLRRRQVLLPLAEIDQPTAIRYAWSDNPDQANLANEEGLPAEPFRVAGLRE